MHALPFAPKLIPIHAGEPDKPPERPVHLGPRHSPGLHPRAHPVAEPAARSAASSPPAAHRVEAAADAEDGVASHPLSRQASTQST
jgi:hypothetical protein